jgi:prophage DNA circulation protein
MGKHEAKDKLETALGDALDQVRAGAQELHRAISDTLAKRASATKGEVEGLVEKAKEAAEAARSALAVKHEEHALVKQPLTDAVKLLEAAQKQTAESLKSSGEAFHASLAKALADTRASAQRISEAVAARRSARAAKHSSVKHAS